MQVSCGKNHSVVLATYFSNDKFKPGEDEKTSKQGEVFIFGDATKGKLGIMENDNNLILKDQEQNSEELLRRIDINSYSDLNVTKVVKFPSGNPPIQMVSCGSTYTLALDASNCVYAWGEGSTGALGTGFFQDEPTPIKLTFPGNPKIKFINAGSFHSAAISINGNLYTWGIGSEGQLGHKSNLNINSPRMVEFFEESAAFVSCGMFHTACIDEKGFLFTWGGNKNGQLGHGDYEDRNFPLMVSFFKSYCVCNVNCGSNTTFVISEEGTVFSFGSNLNGKLVGAGILENELLQSNTFPTPLESLISIHNMGEVNECLEGSRVYQIATSNQFCMALTNKGHLLTWGNNNNGCLGRINEVTYLQIFMIIYLLSKMIKLNYNSMKKKLTLTLFQMS